MRTEEMSTDEPASYNISIPTSHVAADLAGLVRLFQVLHLLLREGNVEAACGTGTSQQFVYKQNPSTEAGKLTEDVLEVRKARRADDRSAHARLREHPRELDLRHADALLLRELVNPGNQAVSVRSRRSSGVYVPRRELAQEGHVERGGEPVRLAPDRRVARGTRKQATAERRPGDRAYAERLTGDSVSKFASPELRGRC